MSKPGVPNQSTSFHRPPDETVTVDRANLSAAIWSGDTRGSHEELSGTPEPERHVLSVALSAYKAESFADGLCICSRDWRPGQLQLMTAGVRPRGVFQGRWELLQIWIPHRVLAKAVAIEPGRLELQDPCGRAERELTRIGLNFAREIRDGDYTSRLALEGLGLSLMVQLVRRWSNAPRSGRADSVRGGLAGWQLKRTCEAMDARIEGNIGLDALAQIAGCSPAHFSRAFKQSTGLPPFAWLLERRIERAKELLSDPMFSLAEVALAVGFSAQPQFTTAFKRVTGLTPGAWRREHLL